MKLIIDIPDNIYYAIKITQPFISGKISGKTYLQILVNSVQNGTPLDDVKAEIEKHQFSREYCCDHNIDTAIDMGMVRIILDNIGKGRK